MTARFDGAIGILPVRLFVRELDARAIDCAAALETIALTREMILETQREVSWSQCLAFVREVRQLVPYDDIGLLAGARAEIADLDLAGLYMRSNPTVREATDFHLRHRDLLEPSGHTQIYVTDDAFVVAFAPHARSRVQALLSECLLATSMRLIEALAGPVAPLEVRLRHARPKDDTTHRSVLGPVLTFDSEIDALLLPIELMDRALPHRDDAVRAILQPHLSRQVEAMRSAHADLPTRALVAIREELANGKTSADSLARRLRTTPRSLRRTLQARGTSYSALLTQARGDLALQYAVEAPRRSGPEIAQLLGYVDAHTFYRAFKRWTGLSLSAYRDRNAPSARAS